MFSPTAQDRCDTCGARAVHRATKVVAELLFCNHCYREHRDALLEKYWLIESDELQSEPVAVTELTR
jgi:hypothetical protein